MRLSSAFAVAILASTVAFASPLSESTVYSVSAVAGAVTLGGTITTDNTIGVLADANIVSFDVTLTGIGTTHITKSTNIRSPFIGGSALTATLGGLFFNFSGTGFFNIQTTGATGSQWVMCASAGSSCSPLNNWFVNGGGSSGVFNNEVGTVEVAIGPGDPAQSTPLPAALPLFATGLGVLGLLGWRGKRNAVAQ
jgi:hypothetical protein